MAAIGVDYLQLMRSHSSTSPKTATVPPGTFRSALERNSCDSPPESLKKIVSHVGHLSLPLSPLLILTII